jgi:hypothetical protein
VAGGATDMGSEILKIGFRKKIQMVIFDSRMNQKIIKFDLLLCRVSHPTWGRRSSLIQGPSEVFCRSLTYFRSHESKTLAPRRDQRTQIPSPILFATSGANWDNLQYHE